MTRNRRWVPLGALLALAVTGSLLLGCGSEKAPANALAQVEVKGAKPVGGIKKINVKKGGQVRLTVHSDVADEIHIHGYDFHKEVKKGGSVSFAFKANVDGVFVIELESRKQQIAELRVLP
ncbi:MAG: hypothetical protein QOK25_3088 [Thermoleophilaceae bacterium]|jgi:hypothetical protein|nr:hypothetical protein [Thermoleophilaceae bacterium]